METYTTRHGTVIVVHRPELDEEERKARMQCLMEATERLARTVMKEKKR